MPSYLGVYLYDSHGKEYLDWTSQAVCSNLGHSLPGQILQVAMQQITTLPFTYGGIGLTEIRLRLNELLSTHVLPGNLQPAVYPTSGAEANEAAIVMARRYTGRHKVLSWYSSYHGSSLPLAAAASGDYRRWHYNRDISSSGFVKVMNPFSLLFPRHDNQKNNNNINSNINGSTANHSQHHHHHVNDNRRMILSHLLTEEERVQSALALLEDQIINEGPETIASLMMESILGPGGCLVLPKAYMQGVRALCDKYGILLHLDEVMVGFGRTGRMFGFQHYGGGVSNNNINNNTNNNISKSCGPGNEWDGDAMIPDILVAGKGLTGAALPLSLTACNRDIMHYFQEHPLGWGTTYQAHPVALAVAYETIKYMIQHNVLGHVQERLEPLFANGLRQLAQSYGCIQHVRSIGLLGCFDIQDVYGKNPKPLPHKPPQNQRAFVEYKNAYSQAGLVGLHRYPYIHSAPPLIITPNELDNGFDRLDHALAVLNRELGYST